MSYADQRWELLQVVPAKPGMRALFGSAREFLGVDDFDAIPHEAFFSWVEFPLWGLFRGMNGEGKTYTLAAGVDLPNGGASPLSSRRDFMEYVDSEDVGLAWELCGDCMRTEWEERRARRKKASDSE